MPLGSAKKACSEAPYDYEYRGYEITCHGYYEPEQSVCWEAVDPHTGCGDFHATTKRQLMNLIDDDGVNTPVEST